MAHRIISSLVCVAVTSFAVLPSAHAGSLNDDAPFGDQASPDDSSIEPLDSDAASPERDAPPPQPATSSPKELSFTDRPFDLELRTGLGTTVGLLGVVGEFTLLPALTVGGGIGMNPLGPVWGVHARLRVPVLRHPVRILMAPTLELSVSRGKFGGNDVFGAVFASMCEGSPDDPSDPCYDPSVEPQMITWGQVELGYELRFPSGLSLRPSVGIASMFGVPEWSCTTSDRAPAPCVASQLPPAMVPVVAFALGYAFGGG